MRRNRLLTLVVAVVFLVGLLAGCASGSDKGANPGTDNQSSQVASTDQQNKTDAKKEKVTLKFWVMYDDKEEIYVNAVNNFNKIDPNVQVELLGNASQDKQLAAIVAGEGPDVSQCFWPTAAIWGKQGAIEPLEKYMDNDAAFDKADIVKAALDRVTFNGHVYAVPLTALSGEIYYNKDLLAKAGYTKGPETIEELIEIADKTTIIDNKGNIKQLGFKPDYPWLDNVIWPIVFGAKWIDDKGRTTFDTPEMRNAYQWQIDFYKKYDVEKVRKFAGGFGVEAQDPFILGKLAMKYDGEWALTTIKKYAPNLNFGVVRMPYPKDRPDLKGSGFISPYTFYMNAKSEHKDEAWKFLSYLGGKENMALIAQGNKYIKGALTCRASSLNAIPKDADPVLLDLAQFLQSPNITGFPAVPYINEYLTEIDTQMQKALTGNITLDEAVKAVQQKMEPIANLEIAGK